MQHIFLTHRGPDIDVQSLLNSRNRDLLIEKSIFNRHVPDSTAWVLG